MARTTRSVQTTLFHAGCPTNPCPVAPSGGVGVGVEEGREGVLPALVLCDSDGDGGGVGVRTKAGCSGGGGKGARPTVESINEVS